MLIENIVIDLNGNESKTNLMLLGFLDGEYVGNCSLMGKNLMRQKHRASIGIALFQKFTGFEIYGTFKDTMKYLDGTYADEYWMMRKL